MLLLQSNIYNPEFHLRLLCELKWLEQFSYPIQSYPSTTALSSTLPLPRLILCSFLLMFKIPHYLPGSAITLLFHWYFTCKHATPVQQSEAKTPVGVVETVSLGVWTPSCLSWGKSSKRPCSLTQFPHGNPLKSPPPNMGFFHTGDNVGCNYIFTGLIQNPMISRLPLISERLRLSKLPACLMDTLRTRSKAISQAGFILKTPKLSCFLCSAVSFPLSSISLSYPSLFSTVPFLLPIFHSPVHMSSCFCALSAG